MYLNGILPLTKHLDKHTEQDKSENKFGSVPGRRRFHVHCGGYDDNDVPTLRRSDAPTLRRSDAPTLRRSDAPTLRRSDAPTLNWVCGAVLIASIFVAACDDPPPPPDYGALLLGIRVVLPEEPNPVLSGGQRETLEGLEGINVSVIRVDAVVQTEPGDPSSEQVVVVDTTHHQIQLVGDLKNLAPRQIAFFNVPAGDLTQLRMIIDEATISLRGETHSIKIPSGEQTGLKIEPIDGVPFEIVDQQRKSIRIVFNPFEQLIRNKGQGFMFKPVLEAENVTLEELSPILLDRIIVRFHDTTTQEQIDAFISQQFLEIMISYVKEKFYVLKLPVNLDLKNALINFSQNELIKYASPDILANPNAQPCEWKSSSENTPNLGDSIEDKFNLINAQESWNISTGSRHVVVAVIDGGFLQQNPDLLYNWYINQEELRGFLGFSTTQEMLTAWDVDSDSLITFIDFNHPNNFDKCGLTDGIMSSCDIDLDGVVDPKDLVSGNSYNDADDSGDCTKKSNEPFVKFENGSDEDGNGKCDDLVGWDISDSDNFPFLNEGITAGTECLAAHAHSSSYVIGGRGGSMVNNQCNSDLLWGMSWAISILSVKVIDERTGSFSHGSGLAGIKYSIATKSHIINTSFSTTLSNRNVDCPEDQNEVGILDNLVKYDEEIRKLEAELADLNLDNTIWVASSGNCGVDLWDDSITEWPAELNHPNIVTVGSFMGGGRQPKYNYGAVEIAAPYQAKVSFQGVFDGIVLRDETCSGTSVSGPYVAGTLALMLASNSNFLNNPPLAIPVLYCNAKPHPSYQYGTLDAGAALSNQNQCQ